MALSLADELGDELDAHLSTSGEGLGMGLGQSLADELDLDLQLEHDAGLPAEARGPTLKDALRDDGLPLPRSTPTPRKAKTSTTSTYYTATASPGRLSLLDSAEEVSQDLLELSDDEGDGGHELEDQNRLFGDSGGASPRGRGLSLNVNDAGVPSPQVGEDMFVMLQDQMDAQNRFLVLLRSTTDPSFHRQALDTSKTHGMAHSLNRSRATRVPSGEDGEVILRRHLEQLEQTKRVLNDRNRDIAKIHHHFASAQTPIAAEVWDNLFAVLDQHPVSSHNQDPTTPTADPSSGDTSFGRDDDADPSRDIVLAEAVESITQVNHDLAAECSTLAESVHLHQSFLTSTSRQIKALRANVVAWKDKDQAENQARASIEQWERSLVERGLRGERERDTREVLDDLVGGFREQVAACDRRVKELRRASATTTAMTTKTPASTKAVSAR